MDYNSALSFLETGRKQKRKKYANNTWIEKKEDDSIGVILHETEVITFYPDGRVKLDSGGWKTPTTKNRLNYIESHFIFQDKSTWYVSQLGGKGYETYGDMWKKERAFIFQDGMILSPDGTSDAPLYDPKKEKAEQKKKKLIRKYCQEYITALFNGEVEAPGNGDCWFCLMSVAEGKDKGKSLGEATGDTSHLDSHIQEKYFVPVMLQRTVDAFFVSNIAYQSLHHFWGSKKNPLVMEDVAKEQLTKSLKRYIYRQYGFAS